MREGQLLKKKKSPLKLIEYYTRWTCELKFILTAKLTLTLTHPVSGQTEIADIDSNTKTFALQRDPERREPLVSFIPWLNQLIEPPAPPAPPAPRWKDFFMLLGCLSFLALMIWVLFYGRPEPRSSKQLVGWAGIVFFGGLAGLSVVGLFRRR